VAAGYIGYSSFSCLDYFSNAIRNIVLHNSTKSYKKYLYTCPIYHKAKSDVSMNSLSDISTNRLLDTAIISRGGCFTPLYKLEGLSTTNI
jgi:hypothetical protein